MLFEAENVVKRFGGLVAVNHVSVQVRQGEIFGLIGPNGAGKTTFLNCVAGVYKPDGGVVRLQGKEVTGLSPDKICRRGVSRTFQICQLFDKMTVLDTVLLAATFGSNEGLADPEAKARETLQFVEFPLPAETPAAQLNTGQLKRLDLARAFATDPKLLLLDEPGAGLTPTELSELMGLIVKIRDTGTTIIVVEHLMKVIMGLCERMIVIRYGEKIAEGTPGEIASNRQVIEAYLGDKKYGAEQAH